MPRYEQPARNNPPVPWFYKGEPCEVAAFEAEGGQMTGIYVRVKSSPWREIKCEPNEAGEFPELSYGHADAHA